MALLLENDLEDTSRTEQQWSRRGIKGRRFEPLFIRQSAAISAAKLVREFLDGKH